MSISVHVGTITTMSITTITNIIMIMSVLAVRTITKRRIIQVVPVDIIIDGFMVPGLGFEPRNR